MDMTTLFVLLVGFALIALIVYATVGKLLASLRETTEALERRVTALAAAAASNTREDHSTLRLQACERLTLMLERIAVPNLLLRQPPNPGLTASEYTATLLLAIREEFEYNVTQQIYLSDALWSVVSQARDNVGQLIARAAEGADDAAQVASRLRLMSSRQPNDPIALGQAAVRREASLLIGS